MTILLITGLVVFTLTLIAAVLLRRVVAPNEVHIVQSSKKTTSYGKDTENGNVYYEWPSWIPVIGISKRVLPVSVFDLTIVAYEAYDKGRVPFVVDVVSFFRVNDSNLAAQRVESFDELREQLLSIVRGAIRMVLASHEIDEIMLERSKFGEQFTKEVDGQLQNWGVLTVKNIELMDIRDAAGNKVVHNIMEKKKSLIEMQSRTEVAENMKKAQVAEIEAQRTVQVENQAALQAIGQRTAEIVKAKQIVAAEQERDTTVLIAEGELQAKTRESKGIELEGAARAEAEKAMQLAPVQAQITLAKEIGGNEGYQKYLVTIRQVEANQVVGVEQAQALKAAEIKIISNSGDPVSGVNKVMDLFTPKGGTSLGGALEALAQTPQGKAILDKLNPQKPE